jgi:Ni,Fe-hydrogenase III large subunit
VETLATFELRRRAPVRQVLIGELERLAKTLGCSGVAFSLPHRAKGWLRTGPVVVPDVG